MSRQALPPEISKYFDGNKTTRRHHAKYNESNNTFSFQAVDKTLHEFPHDGAFTAGSN